jgi:hypothetical protein
MMGADPAASGVGRCENRTVVASQFTVLISLRGIHHLFLSHTIAFCFLDESRVVRLRAISAITTHRVHVNQNNAVICIKSLKIDNNARATSSLSSVDGKRILHRCCCNRVI